MSTASIYYLVRRATCDVRRATCGHAGGWRLAALLTGTPDWLPEPGLLWYSIRQTVNVDRLVRSDAGGFVF
ncbi:MAG: hypothetical protein OWU32_08890 [Firmicutes bacterium]|nr:hypothetical protein [Bacillota bacterium]